MKAASDIRLEDIEEWAKASVGKWGPWNQDVGWHPLELGKYIGAATPENWLRLVKERRELETLIYDYWVAQTGFWNGEKGHQPGWQFERLATVARRLVNP